MNFGVGIPLANSKSILTWRCSSAAIAIVTVFGSILAQEPSTKPSEQVQSRQAMRPPTATIQTNLGLASRTKVEFREPVELAYKDFNELVLQVGTFENANAAELRLPAKFQLLCYNDQPVGPTIRVRRGTTFHIRLKNALPAKADTPKHLVDKNSEQPHDLCTTNLHTHGLHVSPRANADNIFKKVRPQK